MKRRACRAGSFYEADASWCRGHAEQLLEAAELPAELPEKLCGGLVPHAGWVFSGATAAIALKALAQCDRLGRVVIFGADHFGVAGPGAVYATGSWETPLGEVAVDEELASAILAGCDLLRANDRAHAQEHSIEVQLPLMQVLVDDVRIVPITVPPGAGAAQVGAAVGKVIKGQFPTASCVGSTDLTHYGPSYGFMPGGTGPAGLAWAKANDQKLLKLIETMRAEDVVAETQAHRSACGGGAIAATMAACSAAGAASAICLGYTTSADVMQESFRHSSEDAVGYAAVVFA